MGGGGAGRVSRAKAKAASGGGGPDQPKPGAAYRKLRLEALRRAEAEARKLGVDAQYNGYDALGMQVNAALKRLRRLGFPLPAQVQVLASYDPRFSRQVSPSVFAYASNVPGGRIVLNARYSRRDLVRSGRAGATSGFFASGHRHSTFYHEFGHFLHYQRGGVRRNLTPLEKSIAGTLSQYATTNNMEFVAEAFSRIAVGQRLTRRQYRLYKQLGGYLPSHRRRRP